jgi:hypothetical protein
MTKQELENVLIQRGWSRDKWGHYQKEVQRGSEVRVYRFKLSSIAARYEVKSPAGWVRIVSAYYKDIYLNESGQLAGLKY